jgi:hypothetical protein
MMQPDHALGFDAIHAFLDGLLGADMHAKRVLSLANATLGVVSAASLAVHTISQGPSRAAWSPNTRSNRWTGCCPTMASTPTPSCPAGSATSWDLPRIDIKVAMDWTDFDADGQTTIMPSLMTDHGRATPLVWLTVDTTSLKNHRGEYEYQMLVRLADTLPADTKVCIVADRDFGDRKLYRVLTEELTFDYVIRFRGNIKVTAADGEERTALGWVGPGGRATVLRAATVTADRYQVGTVVCVRDKDMKAAWCLTTSYEDATAGLLKGLYGNRWGIDIDQAWRLSRIKGWVGSSCNDAFRVEHHGSVFSPVQIRAADRQAIAGQ